jgi:hypothetical protein
MLEATKRWWDRHRTPDDESDDRIATRPIHATIPSGDSKPQNGYVPMPGSRLRKGGQRPTNISSRWVDVLRKKIPCNESQGAGDPKI